MGLDAMYGSARVRQTWALHPGFDSILSRKKKRIFLHFPIVLLFSSSYWAGAPCRRECHPVGDEERSYGIRPLQSAVKQKM